jgi:hypothetical protein
LLHRELQRRVAQQYLTDDVKLTHFLGDVRGREALYGVYRAAVTGMCVIFGICGIQAPGPCVM